MGICRFCGEIPRHLLSVVTVLVVAWFQVVLGIEPADAESRAYLCFFSIGGTDITDRCRQVIGEAAKNWIEVRDGKVQRFLNGPFLPAYTAHLEVDGHAQDPGDSRGDDELSRLRARAVEDELARVGIPREFITSYGMGDKQPLLPDVASDPQNRRAEIIFRR